MTARPDYCHPRREIEQLRCLLLATSMVICLSSIHADAMPWRTYGQARALLGFTVATTMLSMVERRGGDARRNRGVDHGS